MFHATLHHGIRQATGDQVRLRTTTNLRWMAIAGQLAALAGASWGFHLAVPIGMCLAIVGLSTSVNLVLTMVFPGNRRLSEGGVLVLLLFDLGQTCLLLAATGGLTNPFALLVLAPVTIAATASSLRSTLIVSLMAVVFVTALDRFYVPLRWSDGTELTMPPLLHFGYWVSIITGIGFLAFYSRRIATEIRAMSNALFATQMALAREQKLTDVGGVVAAAAHELGTPLATIKMVSTEMIDELADHDSLREDALLIRAQVDRCRDILRSMGQAGKDDLHLKQAPLTAVVREAAEPHLSRAKQVIFAELGADGLKQPTVLRRPEVVHGLRNLVQNAVDFAQQRVWVDIGWDAASISVRVTDDGPGYPPHLIGRIGDPFVSSRPVPPEEGPRGDYEGMGLGLFIAKTLLERTGAEITFANAADPFLAAKDRPERCGAVVQVVWPLAEMLAPPGLVVGQNQPYQA